MFRRLIDALTPRHTPVIADRVFVLGVGDVPAKPAGALEVDDVIYFVTDPWALRVTAVQLRGEKSVCVHLLAEQTKQPAIRIFRRSDLVPLAEAAADRRARIADGRSPTAA